MELKNLKYFQKTAELQHITKAANELFISQPALSKIIRQLETELGSALFDRHGKNIDLNENGRLLLDATNQIFDILNNVEHEIQKNNKKNCTNIVISFNSVSMLMPLLISRFQKEYPDIDIALTNTLTQERENFPGLYCHLDSFFSKAEHDDRDILLRESCVLACSREHPFASKNHIQLSDLETEMFYYTANCHSITNLMDYIESINGNHSLARIECIDPAAVFSLVEENLGIAFLPAITWRFSLHPGICYHKIEGHEFFRYLKLNWEDDVSNVKEAQIFSEFCRDFFAKIAELSEHHNLFEENLISLFNSRY